MRQIIFAAALALALAACSGGGGAPAASGNVQGQKAPGTYAANGSTNGSSGKVSLETQDAMKFNPNTITGVKAGQQVTVDLRNSGATIHSFFSPSLGVGTAVRVDPGKTATATFTAPSAPGTYQFWCNEPGHAEAGMVGEVVVQ